MYVRLHVVAVDRFGRTGVQVGRRPDHFLASVAHPGGASTAGHPVAGKGGTKKQNGNVNDVTITVGTRIVARKIVVPNRRDDFAAT